MKKRFTFVQEVDMIFADLTVTSQREEAIDFMYPYMEEDLSVTFLIHSGDLFYIFRPFEWRVWLALISSGLTSGLVLYASTRVFAGKAELSYLYEWLLVAVGVVFSQGKV